MEFAWNTYFTWALMSSFACWRKKTRTSLCAHKNIGMQASAQSLSIQPLITELLNVTQIIVHSKYRNVKCRNVYAANSIGWIIKSLAFMCKEWHQLSWFLFYIDLNRTFQIVAANGRSNFHRDVTTVILSPNFTATTYLASFVQFCYSKILCLTSLIGFPALQPRVGA